MKKSRLSQGTSIALLRPRNVRLEISRARHQDWTPEERAKLMQPEQVSLFGEAETRRQVQALQKVPFDFYYIYNTAGVDGNEEHKHKIVDWEAGELFRKCRRSHGPDWQEPFRAKLANDLTGRDLMFLMGNQHRFQDQWLIISLVYPPKRQPADSRQALLF